MNDETIARTEDVAAAEDAARFLQACITVVDSEIKAGVWTKPDVESGH